MELCARWTFNWIARSRLVSSYLFSDVVSNRDSASPQDHNSEGVESGHHEAEIEPILGT
jgi:hypothetical protein